MTGYEAYDANLTHLHTFGPSLERGLFNHAPMVVEALCALGHGEHARPWIEAERHSFTPRPAGGQAIDPDSWQGTLGDVARYADWVCFFRDAICEQGWQPIVDLWAARLASGFVTAACHGLLRTAHAVRALREDETDVRRDELAEGLACWASMYAELPVSAENRQGGRRPGQALTRIPRVPDTHQQGEGFITTGYATLVHATGFEAAVAAVDLSGDPLGTADDLIAAFVYLFQESTHSVFTAIVFAHAVTGAAALVHLLPVVSAGTAEALLFRAWESGCAFKAAFQDQPVTPEPETPRTAALLTAAIVANGDDHVIKMGEACLSAYERRENPELLQAVERILRLVPPQNQS